MFEKEGLFYRGGPEFFDTLNFLRMLSLLYRVILPLNCSLSNSKST